MSTTHSFRLLSDDELKALKPDKGFIKVGLDFGDQLDHSKEITIKEFYEFLKKTYYQYEGTTLASLLYDLAMCYKELAKTKSHEKILPPKIYNFSSCGGCGCNPLPGPACYVSHIGCFSCPRPISGVSEI